VVEEFASKWDLKEVDVSLLLGLTVDKLADGRISLSQRQYFEKILDHFGFPDLPPLSTPLPPAIRFALRLDLYPRKTRNSCATNRFVPSSAP
jgi:hypothetical protein